MKKKPKTQARDGGATETRLRNAIQQALMRCDKDITPAVCARTKTIEGYREVEAIIVNMVIKQGLMPAACVAQLEAEWAIN